MGNKKTPPKLRKMAIKSINDFIDKLTTSGKHEDVNKASLILYWIHDYIRFLNKELTYDSRKALRYNRGSIIKVHFGFRIGNEFGGLHYAVVLNKHDAKSSGTLTVVPLTSIQDGRKIHPSSINIGDEVFRKVISKHDLQKRKLNDEVIQIISELDDITKNHPHDEALNNDESEKLLKMQARIEEQIDQLDRLKQEILRMKEGSVALISQIATVSKIRIRDPEHTSDCLAGIKLEPTTLSMIDDKIRELFVFEPKQR
jgi:hypothetical protein